MSQIEHVFAPALSDGSDGCLGIIVRDMRGQSGPGVKFFTTKDCPQQVGYIKLAVGETIPPHVHTNQERVIRSTPEVLLVRRGRLLVNFFTSGVTDQGLEPPRFVKGVILEPEDVVVLLTGGHGFEVLGDEPVEFAEIKQGPYLSEKDKVRFEDTSPTSRIRK